MIYDRQIEFELFDRLSPDLRDLFNYSIHGMSVQQIEDLAKYIFDTDKLNDEKIIKAVFEGYGATAFQTFT